MTPDAGASQRRLLRLASRRAVELTETLNKPEPSRNGSGLLRDKLKVQGVVARAWLEGYVQAADDLKAHMK